jgi:hypothetical protein
LVQITMTAPFRRMILHRSQRGLTDVRTFIDVSFLGTRAERTAKPAREGRQQTSLSDVW